MPEAPAASVATTRRPPRQLPCRCCGAPLAETFADLGTVPLADAFLAFDGAAAMEPFYPLHARVCSDCRLVQLPEPAAPPLVLRRHRRTRTGPRAGGAEVRAAALSAMLQLDASSEVMQVACREVELLRAFQRRGFPVLGLDPTPEAAELAFAQGIPTETSPFGAAAARRLFAAGHAPALICADGVLSRVAELHDLVEGFRILLAPGGVLTLEVPYLLRLMQGGRFDAIRHEELSYFSLSTAEIVLLQHGLVPFDAEEVPREAGWLRIHVRHVEDRGKPVTAAVEALRQQEAACGLWGRQTYHAFALGTVEAKCALLDFLVGVRRAGQRVAAYGAPPASNTLLNYCGIGPELLPFTVEEDTALQGLLLPGTRIPIRPPGAILEERPDFVLLLDPLVQQDVTRRMGAIREWGGRFVVPIPAIQVF